MIEAIRHLSVFDPEKFEKKVHIIGCGATGSKIALALAKAGVKNIDLWDFDKVELHNLANQDFLYEHLEMPKVEAVKDMINKTCLLSGYEITTHNEAVTADTELEGIVFVLTDTMKSRKEIWDGAIKYKPVDLLIETRMGRDDGRVYVVNPCDSKHIEKYEETLYSDEETIEAVQQSGSACRATTSVGPTGSFIAALAVWQLYKYHNCPENEANNMENELIIGLRGFTTIIPTTW